MDLKALEYTRDHYNRHAGQYADAQEALRARATGLSAPLKKFHNTIKRNLIDRYIGQTYTERLTPFQSCHRRFSPAALPAKVAGLPATQTACWTWPAVGVATS